MNFESAPFKLTNEYVELLGGTHSPLFRYFRYLLVRGFVEVCARVACASRGLRPSGRRARRVVVLHWLHAAARPLPCASQVHRTASSRTPSGACRRAVLRAQARRHREKLLSLVQTTFTFGGGKWPCFRAGQATVDALRARFQPDMTVNQYTNHVIKLINQAQGNFRTRCYDGYQYCCQGIA